MSRPAFYRPELDILRFAAFLAVFLFHVMPSGFAYYAERMPALPAKAISSFLAAGDAGVVVFFTLSSYLITTLLIREENKTGTINIRAFYARRALRIWPLYFFIIAVFVAFISAAEFAELRWHVVGLLTFTENWMIFAADSWPHRIIVPLWSLSVEEQFYVIWPILAWVFGGKRLGPLSVVIYVFGVLARQHLIESGATPTQIWVSSFTHVDAIALGSLLAVYPIRITRTRRIFMISLGGVLLLFCRMLPASLTHPAAALGAVAVLAGLIGVKVPENRWMNALIYLGRISFGLYVFHSSAIGVANWLYPHLWFVVPFTFVMTVGAAALSYRWIELPFLKLKSRFEVVHTKSV